MQENGIGFDKSQIVTCHRLGKTDRTIVKFLNRKDAENVYWNKKKLTNADISCLLSDGIQDRNDMTTEAQNDWRDVCREKENNFISQNLCPYYRYLYGLVKEKKAEGLIFYFFACSSGEKPFIQNRKLH